MTAKAKVLFLFAAMRRFVAGQGPDPGVAPAVPDVKTICAPAPAQGGK